jgi:hypothetical protein
MEPDRRVTLRTKPKEKTADRFLILALMGDSPPYADCPENRDLPLRLDEQESVGADSVSLWAVALA